MYLKCAQIPVGKTSPNKWLVPFGQQYCMLTDILASATFIHFCFYCTKQLANIAQSVLPFLGRCNRHGSSAALGECTFNFSVQHDFPVLQSQLLMIKWTEYNAGSQTYQQNMWKKLTFEFSQAITPVEILPSYYLFRPTTVIYGIVGDESLRQNRAEVGKNLLVTVCPSVNLQCLLGSAVYIYILYLLF